MLATGLALCACIEMSAQQLLVRSLADTRSELHFNPAFIGLNGILSIQVIEEEKKSNEPIRRTGKEVHFRFDRNGELAAKSTFRSMHGRVDTILERYGLGNEERLKQYIRNDRRGRYEERFTYAPDSVHIRRFRGEEGQEKDTFINAELKVQTPTEDGFEVTTYNENGLPYIRERHRYQDDYLMSVERSYLVSRRQERTDYRYNEEGRLQWCAAKAADGEREWSFTYTEDGLLKELFERSEGETVRRSEYLRSNEGLLQAIVTFRSQTQHIIIQRLTYEISL